MQLKEKQTEIKPQETALDNRDLFVTYVESDNKGTKELNLKILKKLNEDVMKEGDEKYAVDSQNY